MKTNITIHAVRPAMSANGHSIQAWVYYRSDDDVPSGQIRWVCIQEREMSEELKILVRASMSMKDELMNAAQKIIYNVVGN